MSTPTEFFTIDSLLTLVGATGATTVICNGIQRAFNFNPAWLALAISEIVCIGTVFYFHAQQQGEAGPASEYFIAVVNGFLVFCSAAGATSLGSRVVGGNVADAISRGGDAPAAAIGRRRGFFSPWF